MANKRNPDKILLFTMGFLVFSGLLILSSASSVISQNEFNEPYFFIKHQLVYGGGIGAVLGLFGYRMPYRFWKKIALPLFLGSILLLIFVFVPQWGFTAGGAKRWIQLGFISIQPSELVKLSFIIYLAAWLSGKKRAIKSIKMGTMPFCIALAILGGLLLLQPDVGSLGVIAITALFLFFLGGGSLMHITALVFLGLFMAWKIIEIAPYRLARLKAFLNPQVDPLGISYQINQALIAIGSGGILGVGFGQSRQKFNFLPEPISDSIFAIFAEEMGFIGVGIVIFAFLVFMWRGLRAAKVAPDKFGRLLAGGITSWIVIQAFINIGAISGLFPLTGIPLPFISYGGTALAVTLWASGILLNISKYAV